MFFFGKLAKINSVYTKLSTWYFYLYYYFFFLWDFNLKLLLTARDLFQLYTLHSYSCCSEVEHRKWRCFITFGGAVTPRPVSENNFYRRHLKSIEFGQTCCGLIVLKTHTERYSRGYIWVCKQTSFYLVVGRTRNDMTVRRPAENSKTIDLQTRFSAERIITAKAKTLIRQ